MNRKLLTVLTLCCLTIAIVVTVPTITGRQANNQFAQRTQTTQPTVDGNDRMNNGDAMMDNSSLMCREGMMGGSGMMGGNADMRVVHQLFAYHDLIRRSVEEIPGGVQTLTESDNPEVAALIQQHVASMHQRLEDGQWFAMMSQTLPILFQNADRYQRQFQETPQGVAVTKTSDDMDLENVLREHAQEVTQFVQNGMSQMGCDGKRQR